MAKYIKHYQLKEALAELSDDGIEGDLKSQYTKELDDYQAMLRFHMVTVEVDNEENTAETQIQLTPNRSISPIKDKDKGKRSGSDLTSEQPAEKRSRLSDASQLVVDSLMRLSGGPSPAKTVFFARDESPHKAHSARAMSDITNSYKK